VFRLRVLGGDRSGEAFALKAGETHVVGRGYDAQFRFPEDPSMSRVHAELALVGNGWVLRNKSRHGTWIGGAAVESERLLRGGDEITLGSTRLVFEPDPAQTGVPVTPIVAPPDQAGYDSKGVFHMGWSFLHTALPRSSSVVDLPATAGFILPKRVPRRQLRFFGIVTAGAALGAIVIALTLLRPILLQAPRALLAASLLSFVPTLAYLAAFKLLDRNGQVPLRNYLACFFWGATVGCSASAILATLTGRVFEKLAGEGAAPFLTTVLASPFFEESTKGLAVLVVFLVLREEFQDGVAGLLLGAASGLGFALVENLVHDARFLASGMRFESFVWNGTYRALTCALVGHPVYTAMTGLGFGLVRENARASWRAALPVGGWLVAVFMHVAWNAASLLTPRLLGRGARTEVVLALTVGGACAAFFLTVLFGSLFRERRILLAHMADEVEKGFIEADELESFSHLFGREAFVFAGLSRGTYRLRKELRRAQLELAFRKWHLLEGDASRGGSIDAILLDARTRIRDARNALNEQEGRRPRG